MRKDIGDALDKNPDPFKHDDVGQLKQLYKVLFEDQQVATNAHHVGAAFSRARKPTTQR